MDHRLWTSNFPKPYLILLFLTLLLQSCDLLKEASQDTATPSTEQEDYVNNDYFVPNSYEYTDKIYKNNIQTALLQVNQSALSYPIVNLHDPEPLILSFDDFNGDFVRYEYRLIHCNADWTISDITDFDYIDGFTQESIDDYRFSFNTLQSYTQYRVVIPNRNMRITKTGNYLLVVFQNGDEDDVVLTKRFMVYEEQARIRSSVVRSSINRYLRTHQQLRFTINNAGLRAFNPMLDLKVTILQNGRWDNAIMNLKPQFIRTNELVYDFRDQGLFKAGKEFRYFDCRDLDFLSERIAKTWEVNDTNYVKIATDEARELGRYRYWKDLNGRYFVGRYGGLTRLDADYAFVHFTLPYDEPVTNGNVYIYGALSNWQPEKRFQMRYNYDKKAYEADVFLKQGLYNYQYVIWEDGKNTIDDTTFEGTYWGTENDYLILVYYRPFNERYDQLISVQKVNSRTSGQ